ncbi:hypothetical protein GLAREA_07888 [Glarea lozoyensis ATCC 20868]|uniref:Heterokaryon incompatibility domain-containing protein n=1 Tax=Glarea lozoyensis (strain ATCC 20868 / MF5171) TaxID=1116229 RepID=S3D6L2_GLAL2|nr:uncharacterized protein GLAREA_07888 [Glarea lozoyensis ATCC 20868]EPE32754.1 hypothetical protein GLAREA_07888 [Glarea lozoyensis ATCC 20868]
MTDFIPRPAVPLTSDVRFESNLDNYPESVTDDENYTFTPAPMPNTMIWPRDNIYSALPYSHQPLGDGPWIRILRLSPGMDRDPIKVSLQPVNLDDAVSQYDALSYVWGSDFIAHAIDVDGCSFAIRDNLFKFLASIRDPEESLNLWADAICIDQKNTKEKNHQVQQMGRIYKGSRATRLWLGQGDKNVDSFLHSIAESQYKPPNESTVLKPSQRSELSSEQNDKIAFSRGLHWILYNPYWTRLWIVQEVILSPNVRVYVSRTGYSWETFAQFCKSGAAEMQRYYRNEIADKLSQSTIISLDRQRREKSVRNFVDLIKISVPVSASTFGIEFLD